MSPIWKIIQRIPSLEERITEDLYSVSPKKIKKELKRAKREKELNKYRDILAIYSKVISGEVMEWVKSRSLTILNGRDTAGKWWVIKRMSYDLDASLYDVIALWKPTQSDVEMMQENPEHHFNRYHSKVTSDKNIWFGDRSFYNRALVEPVMWFCSKEAYEWFINWAVQEFEKKHIIWEWFDYTKIYLSITPETQIKRLERRESNPRKQWKLSPIDREAPNKVDEYSLAKMIMLEQTDLPDAPWTIIDSNNKDKAAIETIKAIVRQNTSVREVVESIAKQVWINASLDADRSMVRTASEELEKMKQIWQVPTWVKFEFSD